MVFSSLQPHEKDAFFNLLDEYFSSRPDIFAGSGSTAESSEPSMGGQAAAAARRAFASNPEATSRLVSAGLRHGVPKDSPYAAAASNPEISNAMGRMAAMSLNRNASSSSGNSANNNPGPPPPPPPRRDSGDPEQEKPAMAPRTSFGTPSRKFGDVDTSSAKNMFVSLRSSTSRKSETTPPPIVSSAFAAKKNAFAPPPVRRIPSNASIAAKSVPVPTPPRALTPEAEPEPEGEWADVLYDYASEDAGDLQIKENDRVLVTDKTSPDWWTGEINGKSGLFPASYVNIL